MAKYRDAVCKLCRREGEKLFLKGERCFSVKCAFDRRSYAPGPHGRGEQFRHKRESDFARQLRAKQKARRLYGVLERQFQRYFDEANQMKGMTGMNLLRLLESRLDNVIYRLGYAESRPQARQLVNHGHFMVNNRRTTVPSLLVSPGDKITVREGSRVRTYFKNLGSVVEGKNTPPWLNRDLKTMSAEVIRLPERSEIDSSLDEQLIVEYYSR